MRDLVAIAYGESMFRLVVCAFAFGIVVGGLAVAVRNVKVNEKAQCARFFKTDRTASDSLRTVKLGCKLTTTDHAQTGGEG